MPSRCLPSHHDTSYAPPRGPVLLLSCMDLRCMDEIVQFMDHDGLTNRYDHLILAGAALGATGANGHHPGWIKTFEDHLNIAHKLRKFEDVYILEHRDCGAYKKFVPNGDFSDSEAAREKATHLKYARKLKKSIKVWAKTKKAKVRVKSFLMDLRGHVDLIDP